MSQPLMLKKLKLNSSMMIYKSSRTNTKKRCPFRYRGLESKSRKSRDTWSNKQICPWNTEWSKAKANGVFPRECTGHSKHPLFQQHMRRLYTWTSPDGQHQNQIDYILCSQSWRSSIQSTKIRPGADCGSDHEFLIATFRLKLKKVGKTTRPFRYDLNQIPYDYTVEVRNRFKGLDLIDRQHEELWMEVLWHCTGGSDQDHPQEKEMQKVCLRSLYKQLWKEEKWKAKEKRKDTPIWMQGSKE